jgi:hypothetical protein
VQFDFNTGQFGFMGRKWIPDYPNPQPEDDHDGILRINNQSHYVPEWVNLTVAEPMRLTLLWDDISETPSYRRDKEQLIRNSIDKLLAKPYLEAFDLAKNNVDLGGTFKFKSTLKYNPQELLYGKGTGSTADII